MGDGTLVPQSAGMMEVEVEKGVGGGRNVGVEARGTITRQLISSY